MTSPLSQHPLVCVIWDDAHMSLDEYTQDEITRDIHKASQVKSFGLMVQSDDKGVTLATDEGIQDLKFRKVNFIPRAMIVEVIDFGKPKRKAPRKGPLKRKQKDQISDPAQSAQYQTGGEVS